MKRQSPLYRQIAELIREKIEKGEYRFGQFIPSERELAQKYGVNRMTIRKALSLLIEAGLLLPKPGKGTYVNRPKINSAFDTIQGTTPFLIDMGLTPSYRLIYSGKRTAGWKYSRIFHVPPEEEIFQIFRVCLGDGEPYTLEYIHLPLSLIPDIEQYDFQVYSLSAIYDQMGIVPYHDIQTLEITQISSPQSILLDVPEGEPVFMLTETITDQNGRVIEYTKSYSSGKKFIFSAVMN